MTLKTDRQKNIYHFRRVYPPPTDNLNIHHSVFYYVAKGEISVGEIDGGGGYVRISYYLCAIKILFLHNNRTTANMPCPLMDGAYFISGHSRNSNNNH